MKIVAAKRIEFPDFGNRYRYMYVLVLVYIYFFLQDKSHGAKVAFRSQHWMVAIRTKWGFFLKRRKFFREDLPLFYNILNIKIHSKSFKRKQQYNTFFQNMRYGGHFRNISKFVLMTFFLKMQQTWTCQNCLPRTSVNGTVWHQFRILPLRIFFSKGISWYGACYFARGWEETIVLLLIF